MFNIFAFFVYTFFDQMPYVVTYSFIKASVFCPTYPTNFQKRALAAKIKYFVATSTYTVYILSQKHWI